MNLAHYTSMAEDSLRGGTGDLPYTYEQICDAEDAHRDYAEDSWFWDSPKGQLLWEICAWLWQVHEPPPPYGGNDD